VEYWSLATFISTFARCSYKFTIPFLVLGPPDSIHDWTKEPDIGASNQNDPNQVHSKKNWRLLRCQNGKSASPLFLIGLNLNWLIVLVLAGLRIFEELLEVDYLVCSNCFVLFCWSVQVSTDLKHTAT
jgi:hypothetical protein